MGNASQNAPTGGVGADLCAGTEGDGCGEASWGLGGMGCEGRVGGGASMMPLRCEGHGHRVRESASEGRIYTCTYNNFIS